MVWSRIRSLVRGLASRDEVERELDDELTLHLELRTQHWLAEGLQPAEAARRAKLEFGSVESVKEQARESRAFGCSTSCAVICATDCGSSFVSPVSHWLQC